MKLVCAPEDHAFAEDGALNVRLYAQPQESRDGRSARAGTGHSVMNKILRTRLHAAPRAWDFLSLALAVVTADVAVWRSESADGWTREIDLSIAVADPDFWRSEEHTSELQSLMRISNADFCL